ncbi:unnamed protein product [marine sediment metagenome]|uniref:Uncharacterized protein n=1 Tax=marine sediment metagenome TaxID=412755 RepID=X0VW95_9ZZZZ
MAIKGSYSRAFYRWRKVNEPHLVALVQAGVGFKGGNQVFPHIDEEVELLVEDTTIRIAAQDV